MAKWRGPAGAHPRDPDEVSMSKPMVDVEGFRAFERAAYDRVVGRGFTEFFTPSTAPATR